MVVHEAETRRGITDRIHMYTAKKTTNSQFTLEQIIHIHANHERFLIQVPRRLCSVISFSRLTTREAYRPKLPHTTSFPIPFTDPYIA